MKKALYILSGLMLMQNLAAIKVTNQTEWPIRFTMSWAGKLPLNRNPFDWSPANWAETRTLADIQPGDTLEDDVDALNVKTRYVVEMKVDGKWQKYYDTQKEQPNLQTGGRRHVTVYFKIDDSKTGRGHVEVADALF